DAPKHLPRTLAHASPYGVLHRLGLAEQHAPFRPHALVDFHVGRPTVPERVGRLVVERLDGASLHARAEQVDRPRSAEPAEPAAKGATGIVAVGAHAPRQVDPDPLADLFSRFGVQLVSAAAGADHRVVTRDEINPGFVIAPVIEAI